MNNMILIAFFVIVTLAIAGLFHFYWAFGGKFGLDRAIPTVNGYNKPQNQDH